MPIGLQKEVRIIDSPVALIGDLREAVPIMRGEIAKEIRLIAEKEARQQELGKNQISGLEIDNRFRIKRSGRNEININDAVKAIRKSTFRSRIYYQGGMESLKEAVNEASRLIEQRTPKRKGYAGGAVSTFYFRGRADGQVTGQLTLSTALAWLDRQTDPLTSIRIEGPQWPYRRKLLYDYANKRSKKTGEKVRQRIRPLSFSRTKTIVDERANFGFKAKVGGRFKDRLYVYAYKPYMLTIANYIKGRYRDLWVGYRFVPSKEGLKPSPLNTPVRPWGKFLPEIHIGLRPGK